MSRMDIFHTLYSIYPCCDGLCCINKAPTDHVFLKNIVGLAKKTLKCFIYSLGINYTSLETVCCRCHCEYCLSCLWLDVSRYCSAYILCF